MSAEDDFRLWEREFREPEADQDGWGVLPVAVGVAAGCFVLVAFGEVMLGLIALGLAGVILLLWRSGM
ncbi:hypothetical protein GCM10009678_05850 [Actinomadura kijaniata]|uniref:Uncharacterized protein n=1 Tax=Actinomadura namibiensis TaxID=182080 RepID=A0A7W3LLQ0_ACTNM|nr:hypothetical protein [Actinomadura namibiensis]MBA8950450.1 hypothetical protein [Actinomadura namibiensis]